jgi:hypothetical protein
MRVLARAAHGVAAISAVILLSACADLFGLNSSSDGDVTLVNPPASMSAEPGESMGESVRINLVDRKGNVAAGTEVKWEVKSGDGHVEPEVSVTDENGDAVTTWTLGSSPGEQVLFAKAKGFKPFKIVATAQVGSIVELEVYPATMSLEVGDIGRFSLVAEDEAGNVFEVSATGWEVADPRIASIDENGNVRALSVLTAATAATAVAGESHGTVATANLAVLAAQQQEQEQVGSPMSAAVPAVGDGRIFFDTRSGGPHDLNAVRTLEAARRLFPESNLGWGKAALGFTEDVDGTGANAFLTSYEQATGDNQPGETSVGIGLGDRREVYFAWRSRLGRTPSGDGVADGASALGEQDVFYPVNLDYMDRGGKRLRWVGERNAEGSASLVTMVWAGTNSATPSERFEQDWPYSDAPNVQTGHDVNGRIGRTTEYVVYVRGSSGFDANGAPRLDGTLKMWVDGDLVVDKSGYSVTPSLNRVKFMMRLNSPYRRQTEYLWDIVAWEP